MYDILELNKKLVSELRDIAKELNIKRTESLRKQELIYKILDQQAIVATETGKTAQRNTSREDYQEKKRPQDKSGKRGRPKGSGKGRQHYNLPQQTQLPLRKSPEPQPPQDKEPVPEEKPVLDDFEFPEALVSPGEDNPEIPQVTEEPVIAPEAQPEKPVQRTHRPPH